MARPLTAHNEELLPSRRHLWLYIAAFAVLQMVALAGALRLAATPWFLRHDNYPGMYQTGYGLRLQHADCEVVLYGDSSALTGLHPDIVHKITGLKTCNVSEGGTILGVVGSNWPLDHYLKDNIRPRFLVAMFTSSVYRPYRPPFDEYQPEGMLYAFQYDRDRSFYHGLHTRPGWLSNFAIWSGHAVIQDVQARLTADGRAKANMDTRAERNSQNGVWPYPLPPEDHCVRTARHYDPVSIKRDAASVAAFRQTYAVEGTQVLVNIAPIPDCDTLKQVYAAQSQGLHDNAFATMPIDDFNEGDVHFTPQGGEILSAQVAQQILALQDHKPGEVRAETH